MQFRFIISHGCIESTNGLLVLLTVTEDGSSHVLYNTFGISMKAI